MIRALDLNDPKVTVIVQGEDLRTATALACLIRANKMQARVVKRLPGTDWFHVAVRTTHLARAEKLVATFKAGMREALDAHYNRPQNVAAELSGAPLPEPGETGVSYTHPADDIGSDAAW